MGSGLPSANTDLGQRHERHGRHEFGTARGERSGEASKLDEFAGWLEGLMRERGYAIDAPRGGGRSRVADDAGVHRAAVSRLLGRQSMPDLETMRRLALVLGVSVREMLIRSGKVPESELPVAVTYADADSTESQRADERRLTPEEAARRMGVPPEHVEMFVRVARQFLPADQGGETEP
jgi:transcriptional regulator with XRE-family HTH domain